MIIDFALDDDILPAHTLPLAFPAASRAHVKYRS